MLLILSRLNGLLKRFTLMGLPVLDAGLLAGKPSKFGSTGDLQ
jgi:hypothetical protein